MSLSLTLLITADLILFGLTLNFTLASLREQERRALRIGAAGVLTAVVFALGIFWLPAVRPLISLFYCVLALFVLLCLLPGKPPHASHKGAAGHVVSQGGRPDERDICFARARMNPSGTPAQAEVYRRYYTVQPEKEAGDAARRARGFLGTVGSIDNGWGPNVAMVKAGFDMPDLLGPHAEVGPQAALNPADHDPAVASQRVKHLARHLGADSVGICRLDPLWTYSHRGEIHDGNFDAWGRAIDDLPPYAVVFLTEMNWEHVSAAPHTPALAESANDYAKGAYLSTYLAHWFGHLGYRGVAQHTRHYDTVLPPLAVDAGLGEVGRCGYLLTPRYGARVRIFATLTDMPLIPDSPISIGVDEFCRRCRKCATACPSRAIPFGDKVVVNGARKWKLDAESCFDYWGKV
nr:reductive dehalogenase domain-containing protein [Desulfosarcinaceae bacterium]